MKRTPLRLLALSVLLLWAFSAQCQDALPEARDEPAIEPALERPEVVIPRIDTEDFEIGLYGGVLSIEDFGAHPVAGVRAAYHVTEDLFVEGSHGRSSFDDAAFRRLGLPLFPADQPTQDYIYYAVDVGYNLFPGEAFLGSGHAWTSSVFVVGGAGNTRYAGEDKFTVNFGLGVRMLPTDWLALRIDARDYLFESDLLGVNKRTHNLELSLGLGVFF